MVLIKSLEVRDLILFEYAGDLDYETEGFYVGSCMLLLNLCKNGCLMGICDLSIRSRVYSQKLVNDPGYLRSDCS